ncbi:MAG: class I SAM-dependent methyltransferase [Nitrospirae bacterium]|nr:MAG: class I SAM-dependent methyltransferase [Nitrospirota bacterium]
MIRFFVFMDTEKDKFDRHAENYNETLDRCVRFSGFSASDFTERKIKEMYSLVKSDGLIDRRLRILDFGCGIGNSTPYLARYFNGADIYSIDISPESIAKATELNRDIPGVHFSVFDGVNIPYSAPFDLVLMAGVLHHIKPDARISILANIRDALSPTGRLFLFEHNPSNPVTLRIVRDCPFDKDAELVAHSAAADLLKRSGFVIRTLRFIHFFPKILGFLTPLEALLRKLPIGAQYYYCAGREAERV